MTLILKLSANSEHSLMLPFLIRIERLTRFVWLLFLPLQALGEPVLVDAGLPQQSIRGFGASSAWFETFTTGQANLFWRTDTGIGLSMLRHRIPPAKQLFDSGVAILKQARDRGVTQIWATEWSPPAAFKTNNNVNNGGTLRVAKYQNYATYLADYVVALRDKHKINLYAVSPFNEPDISTGYESCLMSGSELREFIRYYLGPTFAQRKLKTRIVVPEPTGGYSLPDLLDPTLNDPAAAKYVFAATSHLYGGFLEYPLAATKGKEYWQTEISDYWSPADAGMQSGIRTAEWIHWSLVDLSMNAFHYWWLKSVGPDNQGLLDNSGHTTKRFYVMGNYSKFVRPGSRRIAATPSPVPEIFISAYRQPKGHLVIVAINANTISQPQIFQVTGVTLDSVTPWTTDATHNLSSGTAVPVTQNNFSVELPSASVTTLVATVTTPVSVTVRGAGRVRSIPAGIDCPGTCEHDFRLGTSIRFVPEPGESSAFSAWSGSADCTDGRLTIAAGAVCNAEFKIVKCFNILSTIVGSRSNDVIYGTKNDDVIAGLEGNDLIYGQGGNDLVCGGAGNDTLSGGIGNDRLDGGNGTNSLNGGQGRDKCVNSNRTSNCE